MKFIKFLFVGILFGIVMTKSEAISWYRIQEMFRFQSFHMYGIIMTAVGIGLVMTQAIKRMKMRSTEGTQIIFMPKKMSVARYLFGGIIFGLGWALTGACPGPMYTLLGNGFTIILVVILSTLVGTFTYGMLRAKLPH